MTIGSVIHRNVFSRVPWKFHIWFSIAATGKNNNCQFEQWRRKKKSPNLNTQRKIYSYANFRTKNINANHCDKSDRNYNCIYNQSSRYFNTENKSELGAIQTQRRIKLKAIYQGSNENAKLGLSSWFNTTNVCKSCTKTLKQCRKYATTTSHYDTQQNW